MDIATASDWPPPSAVHAQERESDAIVSRAPPDPSAAELAWEYSDDGCAVGTGGVISASNPAFRRLVGRSADALVGLAVSDVFAPVDVASVLHHPDPSRWVSTVGLLEDGFPFLADTADIGVMSAGGDEMILRVRHRLPTIVAKIDGPTDNKNELAHAFLHGIRGRLGVVSGFIGIVAETSIGTQSDAEPTQ
jgi:PAS domain-containing protein